MTDGSNLEISILITVCSTIYRRRYKKIIFQGFEDDGWVKPEGGPIAADCGQDNSSGDQ